MYSALTLDRPLILAYCSDIRLLVSGSVRSLPFKHAAQNGCQTEPEQFATAVLDTAMSGHNVLLLAKVGTGKTHALKTVIGLLENCKNVEMVRSSGISSLLFKD